MSTAVTADTTNDRPQTNVRSIISAIIGNFMEYFDFGVYGFLAVVLGEVFFSDASESTQLLSSLAVFGVAFVFRPIGGVIFGYVGDRFGRKTSLAASIVLMSLATTAIGLLPSYATWGIAAPILLVVLRSIQGMSVGGEFVAGAAFIAESVPDGRRGKWVSLMSVTAALGSLAGSALVLVMTQSLSDAAMHSWGWRVPFLVTFFLGFVGLYMRLRLEDTPVFQDMQRNAPADESSPIKSFGRADIGRMALTLVFAGMTGLCFYYFTGYLNTYLTTTAGVDRIDAITVSLISIAVYAAVCPFIGALSDRTGRRPLFLAGAFGMAVFAVPAFMLMNGGIFVALIGLLVFGLILSLNNVMNSLVAVEIFEAKNRLTAGSVGYNIGVGLISGSGPLVAAALVESTGSALAPGFYLGGICLVAGLILLVWLPETSKRSMFHQPESDAQ